MLVSGEPGVAVSSHGLVLVGEINTLAALNGVAVALGESTRALGEAGLDDRLGSDPVAERILAVLNDGLASIVTIIGVAGLTGRYGSVVDQVEEVLAVAGDDGDLLAVFAESVELVLEGCLDLFAGDV